MGYASAMAWILFLVIMVVHARALRDLGPVGPLQGATSDSSAVGSTRRAPQAAGAGVRRRRFLMPSADHSLLIAVAVAFCCRSSSSSLTALMTDQQALSPRAVAAPVPAGATSSQVFRDVPLLRYTWNTMLIATLSSVGVVLSSVPVAYALSRMRWRGRQVVFVLVLATMMLPAQVTVSRCT